MQNDRFSEFEQTLFALKYKLANEKIEFINQLSIYDNKIVEMLKLDREIDDNYLVTELL